MCFRFDWMATFALAAALVMPVPSLAMDGPSGMDLPETIVGRVSAVDVTNRTVKFTKRLYHVPPDVPGLNSILPGEVVTLEYNEVDDGFIVFRIHHGEHH